MKNTVKKIDDFILAQLTIYIKKWIAKREYKKHKVDFKINMLWFQIISCVILTIIIPSIFYIQDYKILSAFTQLMWLLSLGVYFFHIKWLKTSVKPRHDHLFSLRKNPVIYNIEKEVLEILFHENRKERVLMSWGMFFLMFLFSVLCLTIFTKYLFSVAIYLMIISLSTLLYSYISYVFDFDEPTPKKKKKVASLTELMQKVWADLNQGFNPVPQL